MNIFKRIENWAVKNLFWSNIIKGILAAFLIATIIELVKNHVEYIAEKKKAKLSLKVDVIRNFADKSYKFTSIVVRYKEAHQSKSKFEEVQTQLRDALDDYRSAEHQMDIALGDSTLSKKADSIGGLMKKIYNNGDSILDRDSLFNSVRDGIKKVSDTIEVRALNDDL